MAEGLNGQDEESSGGCSFAGNLQNGDLSESLAGINGSEDSKICRDFCRKVCHRGTRCKFIHPMENEPQEPDHIPSKRELTFCHDYQNGFCPRASCRFMHCSFGEETYYLRTGHILPPLLVQATMKGQISDTMSGDVPICKDYLTGDCVRKRGGKCRFRHISKGQFEQEVYGRGTNGTSNQKESLEDERFPEAKRPRFDSSHHLDFHRDIRDRDFNRPMDDIGRIEIKPREISLRDFRDRDREIERDRRGLEEILLLRNQLETFKKDIALLKKENSDLRATNDFLLEKVTTLGMNKAAATMTTVTVPAVSLASTIPVATQVSHPITISSEVPAQVQAQAQPLSQSTVASPAEVIGSVVAVSLSQAPSLTAVTLHTSMSPSIAPTMAPTPANLTQAMSISGASAHLVSYPIMTQSVLRPQLQ